MSITIIGPCATCGKVGIARSGDGADLCYRHAKAALGAGGIVTWASRKDAERAIKALGGAWHEEPAPPATATDGGAE